MSRNKMCNKPYIAMCGEGGIWTHARFYTPTPLAGEPLIATWVLLHILLMYINGLCFCLTPTVPLWYFIFVSYALNVFVKLSSLLIFL